MYSTYIKGQLFVKPIETRWNMMKSKEFIVQPAVVSTCTRVYNGYPSKVCWKNDEMSQHYGMLERVKETR